MIMKVAGKANTIFDRTLDILAGVSAVLIAFAWLSISFDVILRYFLNRPIAWAVEISTWVLAVITFVAAPWLLKREGHTIIDVVLNQFRSRTRALINTITSGLSAIGCLVLAFYTAQMAWKYMLTGYHYAAVLQLPRYPLLAVLAASSFLLFIQFVRRTYGYLRIWRALAHKEQES
jgi:TRAP-type C4-dicarboxylate transport system permease small subunit